MCIYTVQSTLSLLDNCDSTYYNIPSFIVVNGVLNSSVISITSYTIIIIIITDICHFACLSR